jgi:hypothetical protein
MYQQRFFLNCILSVIQFSHRYALPVDVRNTHTGNKYRGDHGDEGSLRSQCPLVANTLSIYFQVYIYFVDTGLTDNFSADYTYRPVYYDATRVRGMYAECSVATAS